MEKDDQVIKILWTGGWDSTYRIVELSRQDKVVEPIYVYGDQRTSEKKEINAMKEILSQIKKRSETRANFKPIRFVSKNSIPPNSEITNAYKRISKDTNLGSQHEWLVRLAFINPGLEIGTEFAPLEVSNILTAINRYGKLIFDKTQDTYRLDKDSSSHDGLLVLGNFSFPIINMNGKRMRENIESWGYRDIMKKVWVCHTPIFGKPCGVCHPCELKIETGMEFLMPPKAIKRYRNRNKKPFKTIYNIEKRIYNRFTKLSKKVDYSKAGC